MNKLFSQRRNRHFDQMLRYLRFVLNDHFLLACLFLFGGMLFYYSEILKIMPEGFFWGKILVSSIFAFYGYFGHLATLIKEADSVFLLPKESRMEDYFRSSITYSMMLPLLGNAIVVGFCMPIMIRSVGATWISFICFFIALSLWKRVDLIAQFSNFLQEKSLFTKYDSLQSLLLFISRLLTFVLGIFLSPLFMLLIVGIFTLCIEFYLHRLFTSFSLSWKVLLAKENTRLYRIYRFFSLFTDVPNIVTKVKRRKYLDLFLKQIKPIHKNTFSYLYWRTFLRKTEYSGLALRLSILGSLVLIFVAQWMISISFAVLFTYLIGFQLLPMYSSYDYMQMSKLYPVSIKEKQRSMQQIIVVILSFIIGLFVIIGILIFKEKDKSLLLLLLLVMEEILFAKWYMPKRFRKL